MGIAVAKVGAIGWSETTVPGECVEAYAEEVAWLGLAIRAYRRAEGGGMVTGGSGPDSDADGDEGGDTDDGEAEAKKRRNGVPAICGCDKPRRIRVAWSVWEAGPIGCGLCGQDFYDPDQHDEG